MKKLNEYEKGFVEASIDTDGSISILKQNCKSMKRGWRYRIRLGFSNNSKQFLNKIQKILNTNKNYVEKKSKISTNINYELRYSHNDCRWILPQLKLVIKEEKRKLALEILEFIHHGNNQFTISFNYKEKMIEFEKKIISI